MDRRYLILATLALGAVGCQSTRYNLEALENENRRLEDRVYLLEGELSQHCDLLDTLERENARLKTSAAEKAKERSGWRRNGEADENPTSKRPAADSEKKPQQPVVEIPGAEGPSADDQLEVDPLPESEKGPTLSPPPKFNLFPPRLQDGRVANVRHDAQAVQLLHAASAQVTELTIDRLSPEQAGALGRQSLIVTIEPRDAEGRLVRATGNVSLVIAADQEDSERLARWDFDHRQAATTIRGTAIGQRMFLPLQWQTPANAGPLRLFVRFATVDGRKVYAELPLEETANAQKPTLAKRAPPQETWNTLDAAIPPTTPRETTSALISKRSSSAGADPARAAEQTATEPAPEEVVETDPADDEADATDGAEKKDQPSARPAARTATRPRPTWQPYR